MSAPRTMSEEQEREDRIRVGHYLKLRSVHRSLSGDDTDGERAFRAWAELDAERAAYSALEQEYESAKEKVRVLREALTKVRPFIIEDFVDYNVNDARSCVTASYRDAAQAMESALVTTADTTPRAQAVKEVE